MLQIYFVCVIYRGRVLYLPSKRHPQKRFVPYKSLKYLYNISMVCSSAKKAISASLFLAISIQNTLKRSVSPRVITFYTCTQKKNLSSYRVYYTHSIARKLDNICVCGTGMRIRRRPEKRELGSPERNGGKRRNAKYEKVDRVMLIEVHRFFLPSDCKFREIGFSSSPGRRRREQRACTSCNLHIYAWKLILNFRQNRMVYTSETAHVVDEIVFKFSVSDLVDGVRFLNLFRVLSGRFAVYVVPN